MKLAMKLIAERYLYKRVKTGCKNQIVPLPIGSRSGVHNNAIVFHSTGKTYQLFGEANSRVRAYKI